MYSPVKILDGISIFKEKKIILSVRNKNQIQKKNLNQYLTHDSQHYIILKFPATVNVTPQRLESPVTTHRDCTLTPQTNTSLSSTL